MKQLRSPRQLVKKWHRREKATIDHVVQATGGAVKGAAASHSAFTPSGLAIEDQLRKAWRPWPTGLAVF